MEQQHLLEHPQAHLTLYPVHMGHQYLLTVHHQAHTGRHQAHTGRHQSQIHMEPPQTAMKLLLSLMTVKLTHQTNKESQVLPIIQPLFLGKQLIR
jgi:hypothetical protein